MRINFKKRPLRMHNRDELKWLFFSIRSIVGLLLLIVFSDSIISISGVLFALVSKVLIDAAIGGDTEQMLRNVLSMLAVSLSRLSLESFNRVLVPRAQLKLNIYLKNRLFGQILEKDFSDIAGYHSGDLMTRLYGDLDVICDGILSILPGFTSLITQLCAAYLAIFSLDSLFGLILLLLVPLVLSLMGLFSKLVKKLHVQSQESDAVSRSFVQEAIQNLPLVKGYGLEGAFSNRFCQFLEQFRKKQLRRNFYAALATFGLSGGYWVGYIFSIVWGAFRINEGLISFGTVTAFTQLFSQIQTPFMGLTQSFSKIYATLASTARIRQIELLKRDPSPEEKSPHLPKQCAELILEDLMFSYHRHPVFVQASCAMKQGERILIYGSTGEGKTTLMLLLLGFLIPERGQMLLLDGDGHRMLVSSETRGCFGLVEQKPAVLSGTIRGNLLFGNPDAEENRILESLEASGFSALLDRFPAGLETEIGEKGLGLSEEESLRLSIARALLSDRPILLFDDTLDALMPPMRQHLLQGLSESFHEKLCIFTARRSDASLPFDRRFALRGGILAQD